MYLLTVVYKQCVRKVAVHLGYGTQIWLSVTKFPLKCAVFHCIQLLNSGGSVMPVKCEIFNQGFTHYGSWIFLPTHFIGAQRHS
jgi:hypothetical protein